MFDDDNEDCTEEITEKEEKVQHISKTFKEKMKKKIVKKKDDVQPKPSTSASTSKTLDNVHPNPEAVSEEQDDPSQEPKETSSKKAQKRHFTKKINGNNAYSYEDKIRLGEIIFEKRSKAKNKKELRGIYPMAVRECFPYLKNAQYMDKKFQAALSLAKRCYGSHVNPSDETPIKRLKETFRLPGKSGPKVKVCIYFFQHYFYLNLKHSLFLQMPEIRDQLYEWVVDVRSAIKGRLPTALLIAKANQLQKDWIDMKIAENPELEDVIRAEEVLRNNIIF